MFFSWHDTFVELCHLTENKVKAIFIWGYIETSCVRFKEDGSKTHLISKSHAASIETNLLQKVSVFHKIRIEKEEVITSVLEKAFSLAFFLMREYIAMRKFIRFTTFLQNVMGVSDLQHFRHKSPEPVQEIFLTVGETVKESVLVQAREAQLYGLLIDEVTDISVTSQLVTFIQFWSKTASTVHFCQRRMFKKTLNVATPMPYHNWLSGSYRNVDWTVLSLWV